MTPVNIHGKPFDDLDSVKLRHQAKSLDSVKSGESYTVLSMSGKPLVGFRSNADMASGVPSQVFNHTDWQ